MKFGRDLALDDYLSKFWTGEFLFRGQPEEYWWEEVGKEFQAIMNSTAKATLGCGIDYCPSLTRTAFENNIMRLYSISNRKEYFADSVLSYALMHMLENTPAEVRKFHLNNMNFELKLNPEAIPPEGIEFLGTHLPLSRPLNILESGR